MTPLLFRNGHWLVFAARCAMLRAIAEWWKASGAAPDTLEWEQAHGASYDNVSGRTELLRRRAMTLHLDMNELGRSEPLVLRELERSCAMCLSRGSCVLDLAQEFGRDPAQPANEEWRDYCPNAAMLKALSTLQGCSGPERAIL